MRAICNGLWGAGIPIENSKGEAEIGQPKTAILKARLRAQNPAISVTEQAVRFDEASDPSGDILIDATDNFETRFVLNALANSSKRICVT